MTKFNPEGKTTLTYRETLGPAMEITDPEDAKQYLAAYTAWLEEGLKKEPNKRGLSAEEIAKSNIGYFAGYYDYETMERVNRLFETAHPVFGNKLPTPSEAFAAGEQIAALRGRG